MKKLLLLLLLPFTLLAQKEAVLHLTTDAFPAETYWYVISGSSTNLGDTIDSVPAGYYTQANTTYSDTMYIADSITNITLLLRDTYGDGMTGGSYYYQVCEDTIIDYPTPNPNIGYGLFHNRTVPQCMPNPPPPSGPCNAALIQINLDQYPSETSWDIKDTSGNVLFSGGPYFGIPNYQPQEYFKCLPLGELTFTIYDSYGDGMAGSLWGGQDGSYYVMQCGDTLVYGNVADFGTDSTHAFVSDTCIPPPPILGCMDSDYLEYDHDATQDDSSCVTLKIIGCIDSTMFNYDSLANYMDYVDSCDYTLILHDLVGNGWVGSHLEIYQEDTTSYVLTAGFNQSFTIQLKAPCPVSAKFFIISQAINTLVECGFTLLNPFGDTVMSVSPPFMQPFFTYSGTTYCGDECIEVVEGCLDTLAYNYDSLANTSLPCYYVPGCVSPAYLTYYTQGFIADIDDGSCDTLALFGCTDSSAFNYDTTANVDNGGCLPVILGCMQPLAFNYNVLANTPDSCIAIVYGCMSSVSYTHLTLPTTPYV